MKVFNFILGVFSIFGALYCIFWPDESFLNAGWIVAMLLALLGLCTILSYFFDRKEGISSEKNFRVDGFVGLIFGCVILAISILALFVDVISGLLLVIVLGVFTVWLLIKGITKLVKTIQKKKSTEPKGWGLMLALSIAEILIGLLGILGYFFYSKELSSLYIGIMLIVFGICLIFSVFEKPVSKV